MIPEDIRRKWVRRMEADRLAPRTIHFYLESMSAVEVILNRYFRPTYPQEIRPEDVSFLLDQLAAEGYAVQTRKGYYSALRRYCSDFRNKTMNKWPKPRFPADMRPNVDWLSAEDVSKLLGASMTPIQELVVNLELRQGLRHVEVIRLKKSDVNFEDHFLKVTGKGPIGGKPRLVPLVPETEDSIRRWMKLREGWVEAGARRYPASWQEPEELVVWRKADRLRPYSEEGYGLDKVVTLPLSESSGVHFSNHTLRRTFGRTLYRAGVPVATIAKILGHESTEVTLRYIGVDMDDMRAAMERLRYDADDIED